MMMVLVPNQTRRLEIFINKKNQETYGNINYFPSIDYIKYMRIR